MWLAIGLVVIVGIAILVGLYLGVTALLRAIMGTAPQPVVRVARRGDRDRPPLPAPVGVPERPRFVPAGRRPNDARRAAAGDGRKPDRADGPGKAGAGFEQPHAAAAEGTELAPVQLPAAAAQQGHRTDAGDRAVREGAGGNIRHHQEGAARALCAVGKPVRTREAGSGARVQPFAWEAVLSPAGDSKQAAWHEGTRFWRGRLAAGAGGPEQALVELQGAFWGTRLSQQTHLSVQASERWTALFRRAWQPAGLAAENGTPGGAGFSSGNEPATLLHLVGTPLPSSTGVRLQIGTDQPAMKTQSAYSEPDVPAYRHEDLPAAAFIVLQLEPAELLAVRPDGERLKVAYLRTFGAALFDRGAETVIVLPLLAPALAEQVVGLLAQALTKGQPTRGQLLDTVSRMREAIANWKPAEQAGPDAAILRELALDVTLFLAPGPDKRAVV